LLAEIVDYAGLFPPAQLSMSEAVANYASYKNSDYKKMLGRFIVPVARLEEFLESALDFVSNDAKDVWQLSVLASEDIYETVAKVEDFNKKNVSSFVCDALEVKANAGFLIREIAEATLPNLATYVELPLDENLANLVSTLAINDLRGKIRTGGILPEAFPTAKEIIRFIRTCLAANVPFKATAGLHHPVRCVKPLTYETDAPTGAMHGFLNVFLATGFACEGFKPRVLEELLEDELAENFTFDETGVWWRQEHFLSVSQLASLRRRNIISFGSCSFTEPIEDLQKIGIL
jgi:hypothetical protein